MFPLVGCMPATILSKPVHDVALVDDQVSVTDDPTVAFVCDRVTLTVGGEIHPSPVLFGTCGGTHESEDVVNVLLTESVLPNESLTAAVNVYA